MIIRPTSGFGRRVFHSKSEKQKILETTIIEALKADAELQKTDYKLTSYDGHVAEKEIVEPVSKGLIAKAVKDYQDWLNLDVGE